MSNNQAFAILMRFWNFSLSQNIDFFDIENNSKGIRKKVQPDISGKFTTSQSSENIDIEINDGTLILKYTTAFDSWKETVIKASQDQLILLNENGNTYTYRRYEPLVLTKWQNEIQILYP